MIASGRKNCGPACGDAAGGSGRGFLSFEKTLRLIYTLFMEKLCEICNACETPDNRLFPIRLAEENELGEKRLLTRLVCESALVLGRNVRSYISTKMAPNLRQAAERPPASA
jgi:hypothetical protein